MSTPPAENAPQQHPFDWENPDGWRPAKESRMRIINFAFGPDDAPGECYVTVLPGGGGGALANLNRWRGQVGLDPMDDAGLQELEKRELLGAEAHFLDVSGDYKGVGAAPKPGYRLIGLVHEFPELTAFVKMIGPAELLEAEKENFRLFCESIRFRSRH